MKRFAIAAAVMAMAVVSAAAPARAESVITAELNASSIKLGATAYVEGDVSTDSGITDVVLQRSVDGAWSDRGGAEVDTTGHFAITLKPSSAGSYLLRVRSSGGAAVSNQLRLNVAPARVTISIALSASSVKTATLVNVRGVLTPKDATTRMVLQRKVDGRWGDRASGPVDRTNGAYRISFRPSQVGTYMLRVRTGGGSTWTRAVVVTVTAPAPSRPPKPTSPPPSPCHPSYTGACVPYASDVDCAGGSGDGPAYVQGPVYVVGPDVYDLDRDGDGVACEN